MSPIDPRYRNIFDTLTFEPRTSSFPKAESREPKEPVQSGSFAEAEMGTGAEIAAISRLTSALAIGKPNADEPSRIEPSPVKQIGRPATIPAPAGVPPHNSALPPLESGVSFSKLIAKAISNPLVDYPPPVSTPTPNDVSTPVIQIIAEEDIMTLDIGIDSTALAEVAEDMETYLNALKCWFRRSAVYLILDYLFGNASNLGVKDEELLLEYENNSFKETFKTFGEFREFMIQIFHWKRYLIDNQLIHPKVQKEFHCLFEKHLKR